MYCYENYIFDIGQSAKFPLFFYSFSNPSNVNAAFHMSVCVRRALLAYADDVTSTCERDVDALVISQHKAKQFVQIICNI